MVQKEPTSSNSRTWGLLDADWIKVMTLLSNGVAVFKNTLLGFIGPKHLLFGKAEN